MNEPIKQGLELVNTGIGAAGSINDVVDDTVSMAVNGIVGQFNRATRILGSEPLLEEDPTGPIEAISEGLNVIPNAARAIGINLQELLTLDTRIAKGLNQLGEKGDQICDNARGELRATVELPWNFFRDFNVCLSSGTVKNLANQLATDPKVPLMNFGECALSETILKPIDHAVRDLKNAGADVMAVVTGKRNLANVSAVVMASANTIVGALQKGLAGTYLIYPNPDTWICFQAKTDGTDYKTVTINKFLEGLGNLDFVKGDRIESTEFASRDERHVCKI